MKYEHYLVEAEFKPTASIEEIVEKLNSECSEFMKDLLKNKDKLLYRGGKYRGKFGKETKEWMDPEYKDDRKPRDTNKLHNIWIKKHYGDFRAKATYTSTNIEYVSGYGKPATIFPLNGYSMYMSESEYRDPSMVISHGEWWDIPMVQNKIKELVKAKKYPQFIKDPNEKFGPPWPDAPDIIGLKYGKVKKVWQKLYFQFLDDILKPYTDKSKLFSYKKVTLKDIPDDREILIKSKNGFYYIINDHPKYNEILKALKLK